jgi:hypothetical protein
MGSNFAFDAFPVWIWAIIAVVGTAQIVFELWALVDMLRRPESELTLGGRKWLWAIIILFVNWVGAILYLVAGRKPAPVVEVTPSAPTSERADAALDSLYGKPEDGDRP